MPCNNVTETLALVLDTEERIVDYSLHKISCGEPVAGRGLIRRWAKGKTVKQILDLKPVTLSKDGSIDDTVGEYLRLKHLFSIQAALAEFVGNEATQLDDFCTIESVTYSTDGVEIRAAINLDLLTDRIKACGLRGDARHPDVDP
jgi:hypothetical protein